MPVISSSYRAPLWIGGKHAQTIIPALFRKVEGITYTRERIETEDKDFLDIDWSKKGHERLVIISHGLEGSTRQPYALGMGRMFNQHGWDSLAWNFRSCSGEINRSKLLYHAGITGDLKHVIFHALATYPYKEIMLIGFSLGGNITLKYIGDECDNLPPQITKACTFSVPCDLYACIRSLSSGINRVYLNRFLVTLKAKMLKKAAMFPDVFAGIDIEKIQDFIDFDNKITAPFYGFKDATHYYVSCSSKHSIRKIRIPTLIVNAQNDPFLHPACFPHEECQRSSCVYFESPYDGGHEGFIKRSLHGVYWSEERAIFFSETVEKQMFK